MKGKLIVETVSSALLKGNALGDPHLREVPVYLPPSYGRKGGKRLPLIIGLPGFTSAGRTVINHNPWKPHIISRLDELIARGKAPECAMVIADCFTSYGGSQYVNSSATGPYEDHVVKELVPYIEWKFTVGGGPAKRALVGGSSGGYGALRLGMEHPDVFSHVACHSGDMFFEWCYGVDIPKFVTLLGKHGGSANNFRGAFLAAREKWTFDHVGINMIAMASCYSPNPKSPLGFDLPFDERTGEMLPAVWRRWKALDPVALAPRRKAALKKLKTLYFDCGTRDEYNLHLGARLLAKTLKRLGVRHTYEEGDWTHSGLSLRYDRSLELLANRLA